MVNEPGKILVVDDSEDIRFLLCSLLRSMGRETLEAATGAAALDLLDRDFRIRMVITDFEMPGMDGLELTRRIRADQRLEDLPVLLNSASSLDLLADRAAAAGVTKLLPKPLNLLALKEEIERILLDLEPGHVWRALLVGLEADSAATVRSLLSEAGFQVLQVPDEQQARDLLKSIDGIDLAFVRRMLPDCGGFIQVHLLRTLRDFNLFRLVMLIGSTCPEGRSKAGPVCVAGHLMDPVSPAKVTLLLRRMGLDAIRSRC